MYVRVCIQINMSLLSNSYFARKVNTQYPPNEETETPKISLMLVLSVRKLLILKKLYMFS